jgi:hypothetical protein
MSSPYSACGVGAMNRLPPGCEGDPSRGSASLSVAQWEVKQLDRTLERAQHGLTSVTDGSPLGSP